MKIDDELIYSEYNNWKAENKELLKYIKSENSALDMTFETVLPVMDYLAELIVDNDDYGEEEDGIFNFGFYYVVQKVEEIKSLYENQCQKDFHKLEKLAPTINRMFDAIDFEAELLSSGNANSDDIEQIVEIEKELAGYLEKGENAPETSFEKLDNVSQEIFARLNIDYEQVDSIFTSIAVGLGLDLSNKIGRAHV